MNIIVQKCNPRIQNILSLVVSVVEKKVICEAITQDDFHQTNDLFLHE